MGRWVARDGRARRGPAPVRDSSSRIVGSETRSAGVISSYDAHTRNPPSSRAGCSPGLRILLRPLRVSRARIGAPAREREIIN